MLKLLLVCIMLFAAGRTHSLRVARGLSSKLPVFNRLAAASFASFHGQQSGSPRRDVHLFNTSLSRYASVRNFSVSDELAKDVANELKSELCLLTGYVPKGEINNTEIVAHLMDFFKARKSVPKQFLIKLLDHSLKHQLTLPNVLRVDRAVNPDDEAVFDGDVTIVGDVHGQYDDFAQIFQTPQLGGYPTENNQFIFNGDLVDRGPMAVEIVTVLLANNLLTPNSVHILRGNHETHSMTEAFGFQKEVLNKYDREVLAKFRAFFDTLPVAAVVENVIFVVHGGIGPQVVNLSIDDINALDRVGEPDYGGPISELLWSGRQLFNNLCFDSGTRTICVRIL